MVLWLRSDEEAERVEPLLASRVSRLRWAGSHLMIAVAGTAIVLVAGGLGVGFAYGVAASDLSTQLPSLIGAAGSSVQRRWSGSARPRSRWPQPA